MSTITDNNHIWHFFRTCGLEQVILRQGSDIANLTALDQKLWTALSCPVDGVHYDAPTLKMLDQDGNGRIRVPEVLAALAWLKPRLKSLDTLLEESDTIELNAINTETAEGATWLANAKSILGSLNKAEATAISLADVTDTAKIFAETRFNGDGIITVKSSDEDDIRATIGEIIELVGSEEDRSGQPGINQTQADDFFTAVKERLAWLTTPKQDDAILTLKEQTAAAATATRAVMAKIDDYFTRCRMAAFDARTGQIFSRAEEDFATLAAQELSDQEPELASFPLSQIAAERPLPLIVGVNPYWADALAEFRLVAANPLLETEVDELTLEQWQTIKARLAPYNAWLGTEAGAIVAALTPKRLESLAQGQQQATINDLIAQDLALAADYEKIIEIETLLRYNAHLVSLLNNYVNMAQLYNPKRAAIFQVGTLYMDSRACDLCFHVADIGAHADMAEASKCCLVYCTLTRSGSDETRTICAVFTAGFATPLWVGRNGIFYDRHGQDWDATIVKVIDNAISLREAFWDPWRKIAAMISGQVNKLLTAKQDAALASASAKIADPGLTAAAEPPKKMEGAALASSVAAIGIAIGLVGSAVGGLVGLIAGLPLWKVAVGLLAVILLVSGPSVILTIFKLRARDLAPILNACGWAVNRKLRISLKLGRLFTQEAQVPSGAVRELRDPYADSKALRNSIILIILLAIGAFFAFKLYRTQQIATEQDASSAVTTATEAADEATADVAAED